MAVRGNLHGMGAGRIVHKLAVLGTQPLEAPLNDVVTVEVPDERDHALLERGDHQLPLQSDKHLSLEKKRKEKRKDYTFRRQLNEKPRIIPGYPGTLRFPLAPGNA